MSDLEGTTLDFKAPARRIKDSRPAFRIVAALWLLVLGWIGLTGVKPPEVLPVTAPPADFSAARAMEHLRVIAAKPHPVGSPQDQQVREYLVQELAKLDMSPEMQEATAFAGGGHVAGTVYNILGRRKGTTPGKSLLLVAHYDSVAPGPGAGDDGAGVAALLETARALHADPAPLRNDILFLFTDGEEAGLLGAGAFVAENPAAKEAGLVLNFEGRGDSGPSLMFQTSDENGWLVREFAAAVPYPSASSLSGAIYKLMPNDTDLSVFLRAGFAGMNFAFIGGVGRYHTPQDTPENLDVRSLQHHGSYALALARKFGNELLENRKEEDAIYFTLDPGVRLFLHYPQSWAVPIAVAVIALFLVVGGFGFFTGQLRLGGLACALLALVAGGFIAWKGSLAFLRGLYALHRHIVPEGPYAMSGFYAAALICLFAALTAAIWELLRLRARWGANWQCFAFMGLAMWVALTVASAFYLPGGSYLMAWPALFGLVALGVVFAGASMGSTVASVALLVGAAPAMLLTAPLIQDLFVTFGIDAIGAVGIALVAMLVLWMEVPLLLGLGLRRWLLVVSSLAGVVFLFCGAATVRDSRQTPRPENVFYLLDADSFKPVWLSMNLRPVAAPDEWAAQYVSAAPESVSSGDYFALLGKFRMFQHEAPQLPLEPPEARIVEDTTQEGKRAVRLVLRSPRHARELQFIAGGADIALKTVNGKSIDSYHQLFSEQRWKAGNEPNPAQNQYICFYAGLPESGIEVNVELKAGEPLSLKLIDFSDGLPEVPGRTFLPRPDWISMQHFADATMVSKSYSF